MAAARPGRDQGAPGPQAHRRPRSPPSPMPSGPSPAMPCSRRSGRRPRPAPCSASSAAAVGRELGLGDPDELAFCWVVDFPMYERNADTGEWDFSHNPFSMPQGGLEALDNRDPADILAYQYDVVCNGIELSSGAVRNHQPEVMEKAFAIAGYGPDRIRESFPALWNAFHYGAAAPRRDRTGLRPHPHDPRRPGQPPRGHRLPSQPIGPGSAHGRSQRGCGRPAA